MKHLLLEHAVVAFADRKATAVVCPTSGCQVPLQLERREGFAVVSPARPC